MLKHGDRWFCWVCRKPMTVYRHKIPFGMNHDTPGEWSTEFKINGVFRDCHEECYDNYSNGFQDMKNEVRKFLEEN